MFNKVREEWMMVKFTEFAVSIIFKTFADKRYLEYIAPAKSIATIMNDQTNPFALMNK